MASVVPRTLRELPFVAGDPRDVLGLAHAGDELDTSYVGYGYCQPGRVWLDDGADLRGVDAPLVLALHAADDAPAWRDDVLLEFVLDAGDGSEGSSVTAGLVTFLEAWLPILPARSPIVLAMCNPHRAKLADAARALAPARTWWFADGDVDSWLDDPDTSKPRLRLCARAWHHVPAATKEPP